MVPTNTGECDFRIEFAGEAFCGEVWEPRVLPDEWLQKGEDVSIAFADQKSEERRRLHTLHRKGDSQLPVTVTGIWVAHIYHTALRKSWADFFRKDMATRPNVLGAALWISSGSKSLAAHGTRLKGLRDDTHDSYWISNKEGAYSSLEQRVLSMLKR